MQKINAPLLPEWIPAFFYGVPYDGSRYPGTPGNFREGANCQKFAYELIRHYGRTIPDFRSSELWADSTYTRVAGILRPLDLVMFNRTANAWGAHVGVYLGDYLVIHLSKEVGIPAIWTMDEFASHPKYSFYIGAKRPILEEKSK